MKASMHFDLNEYEDRLAHIRCITSTEAYLALHAMREYLHSKSEEESEIDVDKCYKKFITVLEYYNIDLGNLT